MIYYLQLSDLRKNAGKPRLHGNGFLQLDIRVHLDEDAKVYKDGRLHIWSRKLLPYRQTVYTGIHDHVFDFESFILTGELIHRVFTPEYISEIDDYTKAQILNGDYLYNAQAYNMYMATPRDREDTELVKMNNHLCYVTEGEIAEYHYSKDERYIFEAFRFHETVAETYTATLMFKTASYPCRPRILCKYGEEPDNKFSRYQVSEEILWKEIERLFQLHGFGINKDILKINI